MTTPTGVFVTAGGVDGLTAFLTTVTTTTTTTTIVPDFQIAVHPVTGEEFRIYANGTVFNSKNIIVTTEGVVDLTKILSTTVTQTTTIVPDYSIARNPITNEEYYVYQNGTVTYINGTIITLEGVDGLMKIIQSQQASTSPTTTTTTTTTSTTTSTSTAAAGGAPEYQLITLDDGSRYKLYADGLITTMTGEVITTTGLAGFEIFLRS